MINEYESIDESTEEQQRKRPAFLIVLIVLSGIYIAISLFGVTRSLMSGPLSEEVLEEELSVLYASAAELQSNGAGEQLGQMIETVIQNAVYINNEAFYSTNILTLLTLIVGIASLFLMFNLKKIGFHIYIAYSLLPIITMYIITPMELILTFSIVISVIMAAVFALLYGLNLKHMK
ncbi:MAG TPA: hypothetical protein VFD77_06720 [Brumimicrobium sp.]|nr:hypothetical protein [Brumimicrobium sp.]